MAVYIANQRISPSSTVFPPINTSNFCHISALPRNIP